MAIWTNASSLSMVLSYDFASRRERLSQPNVRSTIQRFFCSTNLPRGRVTISTTHSHFTNAQTTIDRYAVSAQMILGNLTDSRSTSRASFAPSRSCTLADVMQSAQTSPSVSTTTCRLRPTTFFSRVVAARPALFGRLDALAVEHGCARLGLLARLAADSLTELRVQPFPCPVRLPPAESVEDDPVGRKVVRQTTPGAAVARDVEDRVDDFTFTVLRRSANCRVARNPGLHPSPLRIRQIGRVGLPAHVRQDTNLAEPPK